MQTIICFVVILSVNVAYDVSVRDCTSCHNEIDYVKNVRVIKPETTTKFTFGYQMGDILGTRIYLKNKAVNVLTDVYLEYPSGGKMVQKKLQKCEENCFRIRQNLGFPKINIDVKLSTATGFCTTKRIVEAIDVSQYSAEVNRREYNDLCLRSHWCEIEVDLDNLCRGPSIIHETTNKPKMRTTTTTERPVSHILDTFNKQNDMPYVPTWPHKNMETSTYKTTARDISPSIAHKIDKPITPTERRPTYVRTFNVHTTTLMPFVPTYYVGPTSGHTNMETTTQKITSTDTNTSITKKRTSTSTHFNNQTFMPYVPTHSVGPTSPHTIMETTTYISASDTNAQANTNTTNYAIIINSSICSAALILLVIIALRTRCWAKSVPPGTPELPTNENNYKAHLNLPVRRDSEYEEVYAEENIYEEIL